MERIVEINLNASEKKMFKNSVDAVQNLNKVIAKMDVANKKASAKKKK